jgi:hypothetical protein
MCNSVQPDDICLVTTARPLMVASSDDNKSDITSSDNNEYCTRGGINVLRANKPPQDKGGKENAPFGLFSLVEKLFSMSSDDKKTVEQVAKATEVRISNNWGLVSKGEPGFHNCIGSGYHLQLQRDFQVMCDS